MGGIVKMRNWEIADKSRAHYGFIVTKPLQLMVVLALIPQLEKDCSEDFLVVDNFAGAKSVYEELAGRAGGNCRVYYFSDESDAYEFALAQKYQKLFVDSDVGFRKNATLVKMAVLSPLTVLAVYEEGLGSYRTDLYEGARKQFLQMMGCGVFFGGNWRTKEIYLFEPQSCTTPIKAQKIKILKTLSELLSQEWDFLCSIFGADEFVESIRPSGSSSKECVIYLTSWTIEEQRIAGLCANGKKVIVKPHPHIKKTGFLSLRSDLSLAPASIPAEIVIMSASRTFERVTVLHHGSSVDRYLDIPNVDFERVH